MVTTTASLLELSRFHGMVALLRPNLDEPVIAVQSPAGEWQADIRLSDSDVIEGQLGSLDQMSIREWLSLNRAEIREAWSRYMEGAFPDRIAPLPEDWPIGGPSPTRAISVKPMEGYRIWVEWEDGTAGEISLDFLVAHPAFAAWQDRRKFESVEIIGSSFKWGEGMEVCAWLNCWPGIENPTSRESTGATQ